MAPLPANGHGGAENALSPSAGLSAGRGRKRQAAKHDVEYGDVRSHGVQREHGGASAASIGELGGSNTIRLGECPPIVGGDDEEEDTDVYIRTVCPVGALDDSTQSQYVPHLIKIPAGALPPGGLELWLPVEEEELERAQAVRCKVCGRKFEITRDQAELPDELPSLS